MALGGGMGYKLSMQYNEQNLPGRVATEGLVVMRVGVVWERVGKRLFLGAPSCLTPFIALPFTAGLFVRCSTACAFHTPGAPWSG